MDLSHLRFSGAPTIPPRRPPLSPEGRTSATRPQPHHRVHVSPTHEPLPALAATVLARAGLEPASYRLAPLRRRVPACLRALGVTGEPAAAAALERGAAPHAAALSALLLGVTSFFRDAEVFAAIETRVLPRLRALGRPPRVLSVGCAAGAELYSVAMLLAECGLLENATLTGLDARSDAVVAARAGVFAPAALQGLSDARRRRFLAPLPAGARLRADLRRHTTWHVGDATRELPAGTWDLVLCRNLIIYLHDQATERLYAALRGAIGERGVLVLGRAERPPRAAGLQSLGPCVYHAARR